MPSVCMRAQKAFLFSLGDLLEINRSNLRSSEYLSRLQTTDSNPVIYFMLRERYYNQGNVNELFCRPRYCR
jgi:hypothetical protein